MADVFQASSGIHRWSSKYKSDMAKPIFSKTVELNDLPASTMGGERQYSVKNELEYSAVRGFPINLRVRNGARTRRAKRVSMEQLDEIIEKQDIRLDAYSGGDGGDLRDAKVMNKDKEISKEYKKEEKTDMAVANVVNVDVLVL